MQAETGWTKEHVFVFTPALEKKLVWVPVSAILVTTPTETLMGPLGKSVILPCNYSTVASDRNGFIQWNKLLRSHTEKVFIWVFSKEEVTFGERYVNRVKLLSDPAQSDASIIIDQLTMDDNGTYECSVSLISDMTGVSQSRVHLQVFYSRMSGDITIYLVAAGIVVGVIILGIIIYCCLSRNKSRSKGSAKGGVPLPLRKQALEFLQFGVPLQRDRERKVHWEAPDQVSEISGRQYEDDNYEHEDGPHYGHREEQDRRNPDLLTNYDSDE
ncbi:PREDICTED: cell surface A33 antigen [Condylura cristata]|uniref:cell surface A33 antigen n=1 Tax=Condylura cristata TaxID=143302 RepID=UPI000643012F|nr:PREDICTED: cell surface A33 antigen [Condylura cristata]